MTSKRSSPGKSTDARMRTILPSEVPDEIGETLRQALHPVALKKGFDWILDHMTDAADVLDLVESFLNRYEEQVMQLKGHVLETYRPVFRAALLSECLRILQSSRMRFAQQGFNPVFMRTWLQKRLLAAMMGITVNDVELKLRLSPRKPPDFLNEHIERLADHTCLTHLV
ncbi:hypothetical protein JW916_05340 [Candidatus Sumerlaeota bacterium]|nr:hypothetical protein [Candidatus Sumerlaeota bacterium]